ncbi:MAG: DUF2442 domain-containing protein [Oscillospiraceae bacterium]|nr:DUF2442 domain-containing protein [Oscillospiraceae bacterium]
MNSYYPVGVKPLEDYKLLVTFDNDEKRIFDVKPYLDERFFAPLRNAAVFNSVRVSPVSIEWTGGIDMCPDELYFNSEPIQS